MRNPSRLAERASRWGATIVGSMARVALGHARRAAVVALGRSNPSGSRVAYRTGAAETSPVVEAPSQGPAMAVSDYAQFK